VLKYRCFKKSLFLPLAGRNDNDKIMTNHEIWQAVLAEFELVLSKANFTTWFRSTGLVSYENGSTIICVPNDFVKNWLEKKFHSEIIKSMERITKKPIKRIEYKIENIKNICEQECALLKEPSVAQNTNETMSAANTYFINKKPYSGTKFGLNPKYVFETFVVGKGNELANAAAQAVVAKPGEAYNPLFIYGGVGLGKTHLLQAIGNALLKNNPEIKIVYVSSEKFTNEYVTAVHSGQGKDFKDRYRNIDLLLIDDIQFIGGKEGTQEEFFHTFNELHQQNKQVVMTSDRPPKAIPALEDRLRSRFEWGMIADVAAPNLETRMAILEAKTKEKSFPLPPELIQLVAATVQSNIRELEGALNKIIVLHQLKNIHPTKETIKSVLSSFESQNMKKSLAPKEIVNIAADFYGLSVDDLTGKSREKRLANPRQIVMYLLREELKMSYPAIGDELGGRDHTTAMHAHTKIETELDNEPKLKQEIEAIKQQLYVNNI